MTSRSVLGRPRRTKLYDCNLSACESYYKPVVDSLDRKRTGRSSATPETESILSKMRANLLADSDSEPVTTRRRAAARVDDDLEFDEPRPKVNSALLNEYDSIFENRNRAIRADRGERSPNTIIRSLEDEADKEITSYLKRIQDNRPARPTMEDEFESAITPRNSKRRQQIDFQDKLLDSVGLKNSDKSLENDVFFKKRTLRVTAEDDEDAPSLTKWSSMNARNHVDGDSDDFGSAAARARKTRNRLQDLDAEMEELTNKSAAREKRVAQLRAFVKENEANSAENSIQSSTRVVQRASVKSEKKTVTF